MSNDENELTVPVAGMYFKMADGVYYVDHVTFSGAHCIPLSGKPSVIRTRKRKGQPQQEKAIYRHSRNYVVIAATAMVSKIEPGTLDTRLMDRRIRMARKDAETTGAEGGTAVAAAAPAEVKPRATQVYALTEKGPKDTMKGQGKLVFDTLKAMGGSATVGALTEKVKATGQLMTRQDAERVVGFYLSKFKRDGIAKVEAAPVAEPVAATAV